MSDENSGLTPSETAFFENGGQTDPESGESSSEQTETEAQVVAKTESTQSTEQKSEPEIKAKPVEQEVKQEKMVPHQALHQARMEIKEMREKSQRMEQMLQDFMKHKQETEAPKIPSIEEDTVGHFAMTNQILQQEIQQLKQSQMSWEQKQAQAAQESQFNEHINRLETEFSKSTPDYMDATLHLKQQIALDCMNRGMGEDEIIQSINNQMRAMVVQASQAGINPAQLAYNMAQSRGFKSKAAEVVVQAPAPTPAPTNTEKVAQINKGQAAAKSLSSTGGKGSPELTLEAMLEMDDDELAANWSKAKKFM